MKADLEALLMTEKKIAQQAKEFFSENNSDIFNDLDQVVQDHIMNSPEYVIKLLRDSDFSDYYDYTDFELFPKHIRNNLDVIKVALEIRPLSIEFVSKEYINTEHFKIIFDSWKNDYWDEREIEAVIEVLAETSCSRDKDLIKYLSQEISDDSGFREGSSLPFGLLDACSKSLFKDKEILLSLLKNFYMAIDMGLDTYGGDSWYFHWTEVISCEHFSEKMQGSGLLKDPDIIDLLKNISTGIEKHFTLMHKENQMVWVSNNEDKHWIMLFRDLSKG